MTKTTKNLKSFNDFNNLNESMFWDSDLNSTTPDKQGNTLFSNAIFVTEETIKMLGPEVMDFVSNQMNIDVNRPNQAVILEFERVKELSHSRNKTLKRLCEYIVFLHENIHKGDSAAEFKQLNSNKSDTYAATFNNVNMLFVDLRDWRFDELVVFKQSEFVNWINASEQDENYNLNKNHYS